MTLGAIGAVSRSARLQVVVDKFGTRLVVVAAGAVQFGAAVPIVHAGWPPLVGLIVLLLVHYHMVQQAGRIRLAA